MLKEKHKLCEYLSSPLIGRKRFSATTGGPRPRVGTGWGNSIEADDLSKSLTAASRTGPQTNERRNQIKQSENTMKDLNSSNEIKRFQQVDLELKKSLREGRQ
ncbi:MAG: hypothetical protein EOP06_26500 [Proteobacteria bacterium]|nr:MAG: hypothetical protein EOP06_26500 [Pseudomonadota bacterium]